MLLILPNFLVTRPISYYKDLVDRSIFFIINFIIILAFFRFIS